MSIFLSLKKKKSVTLDKMCVFCLYPIPDSQQCVKRGSCRRLILSGLPYLFLFLYWFNVILRIFNILYSNYVVIICFRNLIFARVYLSYFIVFVLFYHIICWWAQGRQTVFSPRDPQPGHHCPAGAIATGPN